MLDGGGGGGVLLYSVQKTLRGYATNMGSSSWYINDPKSMQNFVYEWVDFSIFSEVWAKLGLNLRKFEKQ